MTTSNRSLERYSWRSDELHLDAAGQLRKVREEAVDILHTARIPFEQHVARRAKGCREQRVVAGARSDLEHRAIAHGDREDAKVPIQAGAPFEMAVEIRDVLPHR